MSQIDISTRESASLAMTVVDAALEHSRVSVVVSVPWRIGSSQQYRT